MKSYSADLIIRVKRYYRTNLVSLRTVANIFNVSKSSVWRWVNQVEQIPKPTIKSLDLIDKLIKQTLQSNGWKIRIKDLYHLIMKELNLKISFSTIWRRMKSLGYSHKRLRRKVIITNKNDAKIKSEFREEIKKIGYDKILCFDEVGFQISMVPKYGWSKRGSKCFYNCKKGRHDNYTGSFLISTEGIIKWSISAKAMNKDQLLNFFEIDSKKNELPLTDETVRNITSDCSKNSKGIIDYRSNPKTKNMLPETEVLLRKFFAPFNKLLADLLDDDEYLWNF